MLMEMTKLEKYNSQKKKKNVAFIGHKLVK